MNARLRIERQAWKSLREESLRAFPLEGCGFLVGRPEEGVVDEARPRPNVHPGPRERRFRIEGLDYVRLEDELEGTERGLVGVFHSHPLHPAVPSETDRDAAWPGLAYVIQEVRAANALGDLRAWRLRPSREGFDPLDVDLG